ncbi:MAG: hypothetical protein NVSMB55_15060 [Mycobacteriales bacterium]
MVPALLAAAAAVLVAVPAVGSGRLAGLSPPVATRRVPALVVLPVAVLVLLGPAAATLAGAAALLMPRVVAAHRRRAATALERAGALDALSLLGAELRSGRPAADALAAAAGLGRDRTGAALRAAAGAARLGGDVGGALLGGGSAVPEVLRGLAVCWQVCSTTGSGLAAGVERLEEGLRAAEAQRRDVESELAGPRATAGVLAVLPVAGLLLAAALGGHPLRILLHTPIGLACLACGLLLDGAGALWTSRLVAAAVACAEPGRAPC